MEGAPVCVTALDTSSENTKRASEMLVHPHSPSPVDSIWRPADSVDAAPIWMVIGSWVVIATPTGVAMIERGHEPVLPRTVGGSIGGPGQIGGATPSSPDELVAHP